jgi:predicted N-acetyltransferase YhbS
MRIVPETPEHADAIEALLDEAFGPDRNQKTVYRLREGIHPPAELSFVILSVDGRRVEASIRYWPVRIAGHTPALLLGPIAVSSHRRSAGCGGVLIRHTLHLARVQGHRIVLLVGDEPYYRRFGFLRALAESLALPGPVDSARFLALELEPGALHGVSGLVEKEKPCREGNTTASFPARPSQTSCQRDKLSNGQMPRETKL